MTKISIVYCYKLNTVFWKYFAASFVINTALFSTRNTTNSLSLVEKRYSSTMLVLIIFYNKPQIFIVGINRQ